MTAAAELPGYYRPLGGPFGLALSRDNNCREAVYGAHVFRRGEGTCIACRRKMRRDDPRPREMLLPDEYQAMLNQRAERDTWGRVRVPEHLDPLSIEPNEEEHYL